MSFIEIILIAFGLSMDAFAVSITLGLSVKNPKIIEFFIPGIFFGFFQAFMPCIGYFAGKYFSDKMQNFDHWVAFLILGFIGGKMIRDSFLKEDEKINEKMYHFVKMLLLAIATSIDALAIGLTCAFFTMNIFMAIAIIGSITFFVSISGVKVGNTFGAKFKSKAELIGGFVLVAIGIKILFEHLL